MMMMVMMMIMVMMMTIMIMIVMIMMMQVERMISMFYYSRAARTRELSRQMYPDTPQPDQHFLGRDFETCVLQGINELDILIFI